MGRRKKKAVSRRDGLSAAKKKREEIPEPHRRKKNDVKETVQPSSPTTSPSYTVEDYMTKVEEYADCFQVEMAVMFCERALQLEPDNLHVIDTTASLLLETGDADRALELLQRAVALSPDKGHMKYLYLGQMMDGEDAIKYITKGIEIMTSNGEAEQVGGACTGWTKEERDELSSAYCSLAEVFLTDVCFESDAGQRCYESCCKAVEVSPSNPEPHQLMASCLLSQQLPEKAKEALMKGLSLWLPSCRGNKEKEDATTPLMAVEIDFPAYSSRVGVSKLLLEMEEYDLSFEVLKGLLQDDDEVVGVWYLMGWLHYLIKDADSARFYLEQMQSLHKKLCCDEEDLLMHASEILKELGPVPPDEGGVEEQEEREDERENVMDTS